MCKVRVRPDFILAWAWSSFDPLFPSPGDAQSGRADEPVYEVQVDGVCGRWKEVEWETAAEAGTKPKPDPSQSNRAIVSSTLDTALTKENPLENY